MAFLSVNSSEDPKKGFSKIENIEWVASGLRSGQGLF